MEDKILKNNKKEVLKLFLYIIAASIFTEVYILMSIVIENKSLKEIENALISAPFVMGIPVGYGIYRIMKYRKIIKIDLKFRRHLILRTSAEVMAIYFLFYLIAVFLKLVKY